MLTGARGNGFPIERVFFWGTITDKRFFLSNKHTPIDNLRKATSYLGSNQTGAMWYRRVDYGR